MTPKILYNLDDFVIEPASLSGVSSRSECSPIYENRFISRPLITAPMDSVINEYNWIAFESNNICTVIPRTVDFKTRKSLSERTFVAVSLSEFKDIDNSTNSDQYVCIDIANGHMSTLYTTISVYKSRKPNLHIMVGNIANPETYCKICEMNGLVEYVRLGIGGGSFCTTSSNTGIHYPMGSLIMECNTIKQQFNGCNHSDPRVSKAPYIIADGGFKNYDQIIKALALGADYCMLGYLFGKSKEACGEIRKSNQLGFTNPRLQRRMYGMSTKTAQKEMDKEVLKTAEGIEKWVDVEYSLSGWIENFNSYLTSAMSYTDITSLERFVGGPKLNIQFSRVYNK